MKSSLRFIAVLCTLIFATGLAAQEVNPTLGKDFWVGFMQNYEIDPQESLNLFITSDQNTTGTVNVPGQGWSTNFTVTANQTTTVTIPNDIGEHFGTSEIVEGRGIHVETQDTVGVFAINFNPYTADGTKILPIKSLGTRYRVSSYTGLGGYPSEFLIVATTDDTEVEITPNVETLNGLPAGVPFTVQLNEGESYQVKSAGGDFTGTVIVGTEASGDCRPFAVFSGVVCVNIPTSCYACDHICEQAFPTDTWGEQFFMVPFAETDDCTYRILADEDNTNISVNGGAPVNLNAGAFIEENDVAIGTCFESDKPVSVIQYMQGQGCSTNGDPAMLILNSVSQKIDQITFSTVASTVITSHNLNVVMETADVGTLTLDGALVNPADFSPFPSCPDHSFAQIALAQGSHTLDAPGGFTAYVYGTGSAESYAYSVGSFSRSPLAEIDNVICSSDSVYLAIEGDLDDVIWFTQSDPETIVGNGPSLTLYPPIISDIYVARGNQFVSGCSIDELFSVEVPDPPTVGVFPTAPVICKYQEVQMNISAVPASPTYVYSWTPTQGLSNPNIANPIASPLVTTEYTYTVSTPSGCGTASGTVTVEVVDGNVSALNATTDDDAFCIGEQAQLDANIYTVEIQDDFDPGISWGMWADIANGTASNDCGSVSGLALYFNGAGVRSATTNDADVSEGGFISFAIKVGSGVFPCDNAEAGDDIVLEYSTNGGGVYTPIQTLFEFAYPVFTELSIPIPVGAQTASTRFRWRQLANGGNNQDNWSLDDVFIELPDNDSFDFTWTPNVELTDNGIPNPVATPLIDSWYYVEVVDLNFGCTYTDSIYIEVGQNFDLDMTPDTVLCDLQGVQIHLEPSIDSDFTYLWTPNDGTLSATNVAEPIASPAVTTTYQVEVNSIEGCTTTGELTITVNQLFDLTVTTDNNDFCAGEVANLEASVAGSPPGLTYLWEPNTYLDDPEIATPQASPSENVTYEVTVTDELSGCVLTESIDINAFEAFTIDATESTGLCEVIGYQLEATVSTANPVDWAWTPAASLNNAAIQNPTITINESNTFTVTATDDGGCSASTTVDLELLFETFELGADMDICEGEEATISTGYAAPFLFDWSNGSDDSEITVTAQGNYEVTVTSPNGCEATDALNVVVHSLPTVELGPTQNLCEDGFYVIDAGNPGADFIWNNDEVTQAILVEEDGVYEVEVTDFWNCSTTASLEVIFHLNPVVDLPAESYSCIDETLTLDAGNPGSTYDWSNDEDTQVVVLDQTGIYSVVVTSQYNCVGDGTTEYVQLDYPVVELGGDMAFCEDEPVILDAGNPGMIFDWSTGDITQEITATTTGVYSVSVSNGYCVSVDQISVFAFPLPNDPFPADTSICPLESNVGGMLHAQNNGSTFLWNTGSTDQFITELHTGNYWVRITTPFGCTYTDTVYVVDFCPSDDIYIPTGFTPNDDGINDVFQAYGPNIVDFEMSIYDRWGHRVFESKDINDPWLGEIRDGEHYGKVEVYVWKVRFKYLKDGLGTVSDWVDKDGHITLIR